MFRPIASISVLFLASMVAAQPPPRPPLTRPLYSEIGDETRNLRPLETIESPKRPDPMQIDPPTKFDPATLQLKRNGTQWQLWAGNSILKDFGPAESDANEALRVFRELKFDAHGSVGGVFEYFLTEGKAPTATLRQKQVVPFDLGSLRVEQMNGQWVLRDVRTIVYNFGQSQNEARQALAICRQYGFNQVGVIGYPTPTLKYLLKDPHPPMAFSNYQPVVPASAQMQGSEQARRQLYVPGVGAVGSLQPIEFRRLDVRRDNGEWVMVQGNAVIAHFGNQEREAHAALEMLQTFRCTDLCQFGSSGFGFYLTNGRPPQGSTVGRYMKTMRGEKLNVRNLNGAWTICDDARPIFRFNDEESAARQALAAIRHFQFDSYCSVGGGPLGDSYLMLHSR
jgi:hypothetical protein